MDAKGQAQLEQALACTAIGQRFELAETLLKQAGRQPTKASRRSRWVTPSRSMGSSVLVAVSRDGGGKSTPGYLDGLSGPAAY